ncbi:MAG: hypothetical protein FWF02_01210 [Micrococcales bacterium]|nr:hypothetical protein [Micrococcales bacterium]
MSLSTIQRPKVLVVAGSVALVVCAIPLVRALVDGDGYWLWLMLLSTGRAAATAVAVSALATIIVGIIWWVDERRSAARSQTSTQWLAEVGPRTSTWAPRWTTFAGLVFVAVGFGLVFASGGQDWDEAPWGAPEEVAPLVSLVKLVGGVLLLAAPGTVIAGGFWWLARLQAGRVVEPVAPASDSPADAGPDSEPQPARRSPSQLATSGATKMRKWLTGPLRRTAWLGLVGAVVAALGSVVVVVTNLVGEVGNFPGKYDISPEDGLLRCCTFAPAGTTLTVWFLAGVLVLWVGLTAVVVAAWWWDTERQDRRPPAPAWVADLEPAAAAAPITREFPRTGAPPEPGEVHAAAPQAVRVAPRASTALVLAISGLVAAAVGVVLTITLDTELVGTTLYVYGEGPLLLGLVFLVPVGLALAASGALWWLTPRPQRGR